HGARRRPDRARARICRGGRMPGLWSAAYHAAPHPAELPCATEYPRHGRSRRRHHDRGHSVVSRSRPAGHSAVARAAHFQRISVHAQWEILAELLSRDHPDRPGGVDQYSRRAHARGTRSEGRDMSGEPMLRKRGTLLQIESLSAHFSAKDGVVRAVDGVDLEIRAGEIVGLVGESGSGKTMVALSTLGLIDPPGRVVDGRVLFEGVD